MKYNAFLLMSNKTEYVYVHLSTKKMSQSIENVNESFFFLQSLVLISSLDQSGSGSKLLGRVTSIDHKLKLSLGPDLVQIPGRGSRADNVITTLDNGGRNMTDLVHVLQDVSIGLEETLVEEVMAFNAGKGQSPDILRGLGDLDGVNVELGG